MQIYEDVKIVKLRGEPLSWFHNASQNVSTQSVFIDIYRIYFSLFFMIYQRIHQFYQQLHGISHPGRLCGASRGVRAATAHRQRGAGGAVAPQRRKR